MTIEIDYPLGIAGLTITALAYVAGGGDVAGTSVTFTENTNRLGYYSSTVSLAAGTYWLQISAGGSNFDQGWINIGSAGIFLIASLSTIDSFTPNGSAAIRLALAGLPIAAIGLTTIGAGGILPLVQGDDYAIADGSAIPFACPSTSLVGSVPVLAIDVSGTVLTLTAASITDSTLPINFEMTSAQSTLFPAGVPGTATLRFTRGGRTHTTSVEVVTNVYSRVG
jgi:hypothetical protein